MDLQSIIENDGYAAILIGTFFTVAADSGLNLS